MFGSDAPLAAPLGRWDPVGPTSLGGQPLVPQKAPAHSFPRGSQGWRGFGDSSFLANRRCLMCQRVCYRVPPKAGASVSLSFQAMDQESLVDEQVVV